MPSRKGKAGSGLAYRASASGLMKALAAEDMMNFGDAGRPSVPQKHTAWARGGGGSSWALAPHTQPASRGSSTPGRSARTPMPDDSRCRAGPMPDRIKIFGVCTAPRLSTTSRAARKRTGGSRAVPLEHGPGDQGLREHGQVALPAPGGNQRTVGRAPRAAGDDLIPDGAAA